MEAVRDHSGRSGFVIALAAMLLGACSSVPPPQEQLAAADLAVREADEAEAGAHAAALLRKARDKLEQARAALQAKEHLAARRLAEQALVDAQRAETEARAALASESLAEMERSMDQLRRESEIEVVPALAPGDML
jgi:phytoene/squalene synthetase